LAGGIDPVGGLLEQKAHQCVGGLEDCRADQDFELLDGPPIGSLRSKVGHQLRDFLLLGQEESRGGLFFFTPETRSARVCWTTCRAYSPIKV
jgi:hypothetical protein